MGISRTKAARAVIIAGCLAAASGVHAHHREPHRELILQQDGEGLSGLWRIELSGRPAALLFAGHDIDHDGKLSDLEGQALARLLMRRAVAGIQVKVGTKTMAQTSLEARLDGPPNRRSLAVVGFSTYAAAASPLELEISVEKGALPLGFRLQALPPWHLTGGETKSRVMVGSPTLAKRAAQWTPPAPTTIPPGTFLRAVLRRH